MAAGLGPNGALVERFLERVGELDLVRWGEVVRAWRDTLHRTAAWSGAEDAVGEAITRTGRHDEQWELQDRLHQIFRRSCWFTNRQASAAAGTEAAAQYVAGTAAFALLVADALSREELRTLYAPFAGAIPLPELALPGENRRGRAGPVDDLPAA
jgi:hypothetical protein